MGKSYRKAFSLLMSLALLLVVFPASAFAANSSLPVTVNLMSGGTTVGQVQVTAVDSSTIKVTYTIAATKAWTSTNKDGLVLKQITFKAMDGLVEKPYQQSFKTSDAASSADLKTSYFFNLAVSNLKSFTADAVVVNVKGPTPVSHPLTLVSGTNDGTNGKLVNPIPTAWSSGSTGHADTNTKNLIAALTNAGADWIWKTATVSAPVTGEVYDYSRDFEIPDYAAITAGTLEVVCDNAFIGQINNKYATSDDFSSHNYMENKLNITPGSSVIDNMNYSFAHLTANTINNPYFTEDVVSSGGWGIAPSSTTKDIKAYLKTGSNTLEVKAMNEYMGPLDSGQSNGDTTSNPAGLLYRLSVTYTTSFTAGTPYTASAQWTAPIPTYQVFYNGNGSNVGIVPTDSSTYVTGATVHVKDPGTMSRTGFTFAGWTEAQNGTGTVYQANNTFLMGTANVTLYAQWTPVPVYYTVTFVTNGGSPVPPQQTVISGGLATVPDPVPARSNYKFAGWYDISLTNAYVFSTPVTHDITLYASWTPTDPGGESFPIFWATPSFFELF
ncbi:MAG TPA: InlB B-repeat-containing protein [Syntrophomonadaceae bacterium]|nr:InlB B-repeat-containing protein [Syntrophomonadaceae bacterium]